MLREEERKLIARAASGHADAFEALVTEHEKFVYNVALKALGNQQDAEDAAQEVFLRAWTALPSFRGESKFSVWLYRMTSNVCIDMLRRRRGDTVSLSTEDEEGGETEIQIADERFSAQKILEQKELQQAVREGLEALPENYRRILVLRELGGRSYEEIAQMLSLDIGTVKSRLFRARKKLCVILSRDGNLFDENPSDKGKGGVQA
ncbi:MAG: RNA polymerase sigma factor [Oscillospiraceae bacterium]